jgi:hypothetical protein
MLTARRAMLGLALLLAMIGDSSGQSPPEPPRQDPGGAQQRTNTEQHDTDRAPPSAIKILPPEHAQQEPTSDEQKGQKKPSDALTLSDKIAAIIALFQFFALVGTVLVLICTARRQLRAYISIENAARYGGGHSLTPQFSLRFKNCGQTPAKNMTYWIDAEVHEFPFDPVLISSKKEVMDGGELPPSMGLSVAPINIDKRASIPDARAEEFNKGKIAFYIFGRLDFDDAFGQHRWLEFRLYYVADCMAHGRLAVEKIDSN